jgi:hypothetical protein
MQLGCSNNYVVTLGFCNIINLRETSGLHHTLRPFGALGGPWGGVDAKFSKAPPLIHPP